ncbi:glycosyltransferase family 4 protein [Rhodanobacter sp. L36]|uniref:glycosyltransferase family 4 protein n=1 Tax=Rhodanobacter sp. L36 TaxID=1747221 RepID=UPI0020B13AE0|nr:glycosyltransferase family 4 protein [Rhodanobacter sp. L36]
MGDDVAKRLKILILTNLFPTPWDPLRGAFNRQQFERLGARHDVDVLTAVDFRERFGGVRGNVHVDNVRTDHFVFVYPPRFGRSLHAFTWAISLMLQRWRKLRRSGYDVLLLSWAYPDAAAASWLARRLKIPYVVKVHGSDLNVAANFRLRRAQIRSALKHAGAVVAVSKALAEKAVTIGADAARVHTIYNGVDSELFAPGEQTEARARLGLSSGAPLLLYVGNLKSTKGCVDLLDAFPALLAQRPDARLIFVGSGASRAELLERAAATGCAERVTLMGAVAHGTLGDWFRAADLLCLPSHNEGVPNVVLEAMACGTPVVATRVGGIPEVVPDDAGILVPVQDRTALEKALLEATARSWDHARIAAHARGFRWSDNIDRLEQILQSVAAGERPAFVETANL